MRMKIIILVYKKAYAKPNFFSNNVIVHSLKKFKQTLDKSSSEMSSESSSYSFFLFLVQQHCHNAIIITIKTANPATITSTNNQAEIKN